MLSTTQKKYGMKTTKKSKKSLPQVHILGDLQDVKNLVSAVNKKKTIVLFHNGEQDLFYLEIGDEVREIRQKDISRLEKGAYTDDSPSIKTLRKIADGLKEPLELILTKAGLTKEDYIKSASTPTFLRAKYDLNQEQIRSVESFIAHVKKTIKN